MLASPRYPHTMLSLSATNTLLDNSRAERIAADMRPKTVWFLPVIRAFSCHGRGHWNPARDHCLIRLGFCLQLLNKLWGGGEKNRCGSKRKLVTSVGLGDSVESFMPRDMQGLVIRRSQANRGVTDRGLSGSVIESSPGTMADMLHDWNFDEFFGIFGLIISFIHIYAYLFAPEGLTSL